MRIGVPKEIKTLEFRVGATPPWRDVVVDGVRLAVDDAGDGPAIVCLHAIGHGAADEKSDEAEQEPLGQRVAVIQSRQSHEPSRAARPAWSRSPAAPREALTTISKSWSSL